MAASTMEKMAVLAPIAKLREGRWQLGAGRVARGMQNAWRVSFGGIVPDPTVAVELGKSFLYSCCRLTGQSPGGAVMDGDLGGYLAN